MTTSYGEDANKQNKAYARHYDSDERHSLGPGSQELTVMLRLVLLIAMRIEVMSSDAFDARGASTNAT